MPVAYRSHTLRPTGAPGDVGGSSLACPTPAGATVGDVLVAFVSRSQTSASATAVTASGWTSAAFYPGATGPDRMLAAVLWRAVTVSEPGSHTFTTVGATATDQFSIHCYALSGADTTNPIMAGPALTTAAGGAGSNCTAPSLTLPSAGMLLCWYGLPHWAPGTGSSFTPPAGMTERIDNDPGSWLQCASYTESRAAGATGTRTAVYSATPAGPPRGVSVAIREGSSAPTAPTVDAGADVTTVTGGTFARTATELANGATISSRAWTIVSGPAGAGTTIGTAAALSWSPTVVGTYVLRYTATNSAGTGTDDVTVTVVDPPPASAIPTLVPGQSATAITPNGAASVDLPSPATAGNLVVFAFGGDKSMGALTMTSAGPWTKTVELGTGDSTLYLAWKTATGGEQTITGTLATAAAGGRAWVGEYTATGGAWLVAALATNPTSGVAGTTWSTGTTGAATASGLGLALWSVDTAEGLGTPTYSDNFLPRFTEPGDPVTSRGGLWVAEREVLAGATATSTLSRPDAVQPDQMAGALVVFAREAPNRALTSAWLGIDTVLARTSGEAGDTVRVAFSTTSGMSGPVYSASATPDSRGTTRHAIPAGLAPNTAHWYQVERGGTLVGAPRAFRTLPAEGATSWSFGFASCRDHIADAPILADAVTRGVSLFVQHGDIHYRDITTNSEATFHAAYDELHTRTQFNALLAGTPTTYTWSDHDGPVDATSAARPAAQSVYRARVPHPPLPSTAGIHHTFRVGRVRFIVLDTRSYASPATNTDGASKTKIGTEQRTWLQGLLAAPDTPLTMIVSAEGWIGGADSGQDHWGLYQTERSLIGGWISASATRCVMLCGDAHMLAYDDGRNAVGGVTVWHAAALARSGSVKGGPYSGGTLAGSGQYGYVEIADTGSQIAATYRGIRSDTSVWNTHTVTVATPVGPEPGRALLAA